MIAKNEVYEVCIEDLTLEGSGVCRIDGFAVFVPLTAPGDVARVKIVKVLKSYGFGILEELITPIPRPRERSRRGLRRFSEMRRLLLPAPDL